MDLYKIYGYTIELAGPATQEHAVFDRDGNLRGIYANESKAWLAATKFAEDDERKETSWPDTKF